MAATQTRAKDKDPKALSGGEKSFSTICLLLALWESIGCPIRCLGAFFLPNFTFPLFFLSSQCFDAYHLLLDEFDVFMDAVNRRISMKMMVSYRRSALANPTSDPGHISPRSTPPKHQMANNTSSSHPRICRTYPSQTLFGCIG